MFWKKKQKIIRCYQVVGGQQFPIDDANFQKLTKQLKEREDILLNGIILEVQYIK